MRSAARMTCSAVFMRSIKRAKQGNAVLKPRTCARSRRFAATSHLAPPLAHRSWIRQASQRCSGDGSRRTALVRSGNLGRR
eukprot:6211349-Pleurochrysis_carterae.AAC.1